MHCLRYRSRSYGYVMESGRIILSGKAADLLDDERVQQAYLGMRRRQQ